MSEKLKPCPFCGVEAEYLGTYEDEDGFKLHQVGCPSDLCIGDCFAIGVTKKQAIEAWNKRPNPWHTGTPIEDGEYLVCMKGRKSGNILYEKLNFSTETDELMGAFRSKWEIIAWQKIEPYEASKEKEEK